VIVDAPAGAGAPSRSDARWIAALALEVRLAVVIWAALRFPPTADGTYYQRIAERIAQGLGYTWLWPDGAVTFAAHYPIGYPAAIGAIYAVVGPHPWAAMVLNAALGALAAYAAHRLAARSGSRVVALVAGLLVALHPGLVAYTPALMTEGVVAALVVVAAGLAAWTRDRPASRFLGVTLLGLVLGLATLVRPQSLVLAPLFAAIAIASDGGLRRRAIAAALATLVTLAVCAPWTARNCVRMKRCALVSVNGGWNLLIGADTASTGAWSPVQVPDACREVYDEAEKDRCFGRAAQGYIAAHPLAWVGLAPRKLAATFDYAGAAGWYLHASNAEAFPDRAKVALGAVETLFERVVLVLALAGMARRPGLPGGEEPRRRRLARLAVAVVGAVSALTLHAWIAYVALVVVALLRGRSLWRGPVLFGATAATVAATIATHAVFFGAGRYSLVVFPLVAALAALAFAPTPSGAGEDAGEGAGEDAGAIRET
jgi:4-amino-4-deoxy-L-arabinose transferase-like glycosyltransferase